MSDGNNFNPNDYIDDYWVNNGVPRQLWSKAVQAAGVYGEQLAREEYSARGFDVIKKTQGGKGGGKFDFWLIDRRTKNQVGILKLEVKVNGSKQSKIQEDDERISKRNGIPYITKRYYIPLPTALNMLGYNPKR